MIGFSAFHEFIPFTQGTFVSLGTLLKNKPLYDLFSVATVVTLLRSNELPNFSLPGLCFPGKILNSVLPYSIRSCKHQKCLPSYCLRHIQDNMDSIF